MNPKPKKGKKAEFIPGAARAANCPASPGKQLE